MYYILYLSSLCRRRRWSDPHYECQYHPTGVSCTVRVNNLEYQSEGMADSDVLAREAAAMRAYMLCRNCSSDILLPTGALGSGNSAGSASTHHQHQNQHQNQHQQVSASTAGGLVPSHRGYHVPGGASSYVTGSRQGTMPLVDGSSGRMVTSQGVIVVGHSQVGT